LARLDQFFLVHDEVSGKPFSGYAYSLKTDTGIYEGHLSENGHTIKVYADDTASAHYLSVHVARIIFLRIALLLCDMRLRGIRRIHCGEKEGLQPEWGILCGALHKPLQGGTSFRNRAIGNGRAF